MIIEHITVPDLGEASEVEVIELLVAVGDNVAENDSLLVLESDKAAMEIPAPMAGVVSSIEINLGDKVSAGSPMLSLEVKANDGSIVSDDTGPASDSVAGSGHYQPDSSQENEQQAKTERGEQDRGKVLPGSGTTFQSADSETALEQMELVAVPDLGTEEEVDVIELHVAVGDQITADETLITLESDKAAMEVPSPMAGVVDELMIRVGDKVKTGAGILRVKTMVTGKKTVEESALFAPKIATVPEKKPTANATSSVRQSSTIVETSSGLPSAGKSQGKVYAGPAVRKLARELGVNLRLVAGTGARGRIIKEDVHEFIKSRINVSSNEAVAGASGIVAVPDVDFSRFGEISEQERSKLQKATAINMQRSWASVPHVAQFNQADVTELEEFRAELKPQAERRGIKLTFVPFLLKACAKALEEYPQFNVSLHSSGEYVIQKNYCHLGMAVATKAGLVVPVIRDVDNKSIWELAKEVSVLSEKARERKLSLEEMQGACFTVSSLGAIGGTGFIPIINPPEVAILGVAKVDIRPVYINGEFIPRKILPLTLSYDHKVLNGVDGGLFADYLVKLLSDIRHLSL
ncbi:MAG: dihydrolipoyllysine-residue acetyltransferase [Gammaproteobacteria bacterium]|nr:dihydrolipoyllysine-residue acetyltransferase [Gammaproteobacteria bacterium]